MSDIEEIKKELKENVYDNFYNSYGFEGANRIIEKHFNSQKQTIDKLTKEVEELRKLKNNWIHKSSLFEEIAATEIEKNTKLKEQLKDIKSQLFDVNNCDTTLTLAIEQLLTKNK